MTILRQQTIAIARIEGIIKEVTFLTAPADHPQCAAEPEAANRERRLGRAESREMPDPSVRPLASSILWVELRQGPQEMSPLGPKR
jgi:hypothetical protein